MHYHAIGKATAVFDTYWRLAAERQAVFFKRALGQTKPWSKDVVLQRFKFTNAYRAADRTTQYLIRNVIYKGEQSAREVFLRVMLFKLFNRIDTWQLLCKHFGLPETTTFSVDSYSHVLTEARSRGARVYSAAYIMPSGRSAYGYNEKHTNHLSLLQAMLEDGVPERIAGSLTMRDAYNTLVAFPTIGPFLGYQLATDINYSTSTEFNEMEFVVAGPGARSGIRKCFVDTAGYSDADIIRWVADNQENEFERRGLRFQTLWGRRLQLIDCQNLFCEVDKYARAAHPEVAGIGGRSRIKRKFTPSEEPIDYWFPPKWGLNDRVAQWKEQYALRAK